MKNTLVIFVKEPKPGWVKTRLHPFLSFEKAARIYQWIADEILRALKNRSNYDIVLSYAGRRRNIQRWIGNHFLWISQGRGDLGRRIASTFEKLEQLQYKKMILIGSDQLGITPSLIQWAFNKLDRYDMVWGPAWDGGFYLIGVKQSLPRSFFSGIEWSCEKTLFHCLRNAKAHGLSSVLSRDLGDIDTYEDLVFHYWRMKLKRCRAFSGVSRLEKILSD